MAPRTRRRCRDREERAEAAARAGGVFGAIFIGTIVLTPRLGVATVLVLIVGAIMIGR